MSRLLTVVAVIGLATSLLADGGKPTADAERLVRQLGAARHADREAAFRALDALGAAARPALQDGVKSGNPEVSRRAGELLARLDRQAESAAALAPTTVQLKATDVPLAEVVRDLSKQSHMKFLLAREPVDLAGRHVTLDTGPVNVWDALAAVCRAARVSVRSGTLDPDGNDAANAGNVVMTAPAAVPNAAGGLVLTTTVATRSPADEPLVIQDGVLPEYPTAILGAVRVRLIPDRWANRDRKPGEEVKWTLEVLTEPRITWVARPSLRFNPVPGLRADTTPSANGEAHAPHAPVRTISSVRTAVEGRGPVRHELPVYVTTTAAGGPVELTGVLGGTVQAPAGDIVAVADVAAEKATTAAKDGTRMTIRDSQRADDGTVTLKVEVERPNGPGMSTTVASSRTRRPTVNGLIPATAVRAMTGVIGVEAFRLTDAAGREFQVTVTRSEVRAANGAAVGTFTLECEPANRADRPKGLALTGPRPVPVEAAFTLRGVPRP